MRLAPADVAARGRGTVERNELVAWAAGIVRDDGVTRIHRLHEFPDDAVGRNRHLVRGQLRHPLPQPGFPGLQYLSGRVAIDAPLWTEILDSVDELAQHQLGVAQNRVVRGIVL